MYHVPKFRLLGFLVLALISLYVSPLDLLWVGLLPSLSNLYAEILTPTTSELDFI